MKIKPLNQNIIITIDEGVEKTESGLALVSEKGERTESVAIKGTVTAIDPTTPKEEQIVALGDRVLVEKWETYQTSIAGKKYVIVKPKHVLGILLE